MEEARTESQQIFWLVMKLSHLHLQPSQRDMWRATKVAHHGGPAKPRKWGIMADRQSHESGASWRTGNATKVAHHGGPAKPWKWRIMAVRQSHESGASWQTGKATKVAHHGGPAKPRKWRIVSRSLKVSFIQSPQQGSLPSTLIKENKFHMSLNKTNKWWQHTELHSNWSKDLPESSQRSFWFFIQLWPWVKVKAIQTDMKMAIIADFKEISLQMS